MAEANTRKPAARKVGPTQLFVAAAPGVTADQIYAVTTDPMHLVNLMAEKGGQIAVHKTPLIKAKKGGSK